MLDLDAIRERLARHQSCDEGELCSACHALVDKDIPALLDALEQARAENAQLREALEEFLEDHRRLPRDAWPTDGDALRPHCKCRACLNARTALTAPAADWLQAHDEQVRREEREACAEIAEDAYEHTDCGEYGWLSGDKIAAAIRNREGKA